MSTSIYQFVSGPFKLLQVTESDSRNSAFCQRQLQHVKTSTKVKLNLNYPAEIPPRAQDYDKNDAEVYVIIHGYMSSAKDEWVKRMAYAYGQLKGGTVICPDWSQFARPPYSRAVSNVDKIGPHIAESIRTIINKRNCKPEMVHLIGHSLGAHIAGYIGQRIRGIGRITGLDPAGPLFDIMPPNKRLDPSDAYFVDVIHTDSEIYGYGFQQPCGHVDFYPNGGSRQPGCNTEFFWSEFSPEANVKPTDLSTSHGRAIEYFIESLSSSSLNDKQRALQKSQFIAFLCGTYEDFLNGNCMTCGPHGLQCSLMGIHADLYRGKGLPWRPRKFYLKTSHPKPYSGYHYGIYLTVGGESEAPYGFSGNLDVTLCGNMGCTDLLRLTRKEGEMINRKSYSFMVYSRYNVGRIIMAEITWEPRNNASCASCDINLYASRMSVTNFGMQDREGFIKTSICAEDGVELKKSIKTTVTFRC